MFRSRPISEPGNGTEEDEPSDLAFDLEKLLGEKNISGNEGRQFTPMWHGSTLYFLVGP